MPAMELFFLQYFLFLLPLPIFIYLIFLTTPSKKNTKYIGFTNLPILGALPDFIKNRHRFLDWSADILGNCPTSTAAYRTPGKVDGVMTADPSNVEYMLKTNFDNYPKGHDFRAFLQDFVGNGIFNSDGELWRDQRKTASYAFNTKSLRNFAMENVRLEIQNRLVPVLARAAETGCRLDLQNVLQRFAFDNICKMAFNFDPACLGGDERAATEFMQAFEDAATIIAGRFLYAFEFILPIKKYLNVGSERRLKEAIVTVHSFADNIIRSRMERVDNEEHDDLLSRFIGNGSNNSPEFLRDVVISMILAGRDTTSSALSWFFWIISSRPKVQSNILRELEVIRARKGKRIGDTYEFDELRDMHYLQAAILESMRLYPPVPMDSKACLNDDVMPDGTVVRKGWLVTYHAYAMGRMERIWGKECLEYLPERWLGEDGTCQQESPFRFAVFHAGPRMCLGKDLALIQMKSIVASVIERFEIEVEDKDTRPVPLMAMTLRMEGGLPVNVVKR